MNGFKIGRKIYKKDINFQVPATIPYDISISTDPKNKMKKGEEQKWLKMIVSQMNDDHGK